MLNRKQADYLKCMKSNSNLTAFRVKVWEVVVYIGYCDVKHNT